MDLGSDDMLRCIALYVTLSSSQQATLAVEWIPLLSQITSFRMRKIVFHIAADAVRTLEVVAWSELSDIFAQPQFSHLETILFFISRVADRDAATDFIRSKLAGQRGILAFC